MPSRALTLPHALLATLLTLSYAPGCEQRSPSADDEPAAKAGAGDEPAAKTEAGDESAAKTKAGDEPAAQEAGDRPAAETEAGGEPAAKVTVASAEEVLEAVRAPGASAVLLNVWALWCQPCVEEFPAIVKLHQEHAGRGLRVIFVSLDDPSKADDVRAFVQQQGVDFETYLRAGKDEPFIEGLSEEWSGTVPMTTIYDGDGVAKIFWEGEADHATFERRLLEVLPTP